MVIFNSYFDITRGYIVYISEIAANLQSQVNQKGANGDFDWVAHSNCFT